MCETGEQWFALLAKEQRDVLFARASRRNVKAGTLVVRGGAAADELYVVISGKLRSADFRRAARAVTFETLGPDQVFGEIALFAGGTRSADIEAEEDCELLVLRRPEVLLAMRQEPEIATALLQAMAETIVRLREAREASEDVAPAGAASGARHRSLEE
ncbi:MAG TPA: cyclic nucleotide-binding domain-containing protein [Polyangiaceae bacterium]